MTKRIWKNYFDIVILPPRNVSEYAIGLSKGLSKYGTKWTLGKRSYIPHISFYHIPVKPEHFSAFISEIKKTIKGFLPRYIRSTAIKSNLLMFDKPMWIQKLYFKIIKNTFKYYDWGYGTNKYWPLNHLPKDMQMVGARFMKKYGTPMVGTNFRPHVTLTTFRDVDIKIKVKSAKKFKFKPDRIYVCELGPSHSCQRVVKRIPFFK